ncbi:MAG: M67 family metallopeptidase [Candidatus Dormibacteria bacterium]
MSRDGVRLDEEAVDAVRRYAVAAYPHEGCGVLVGRWDPDGITVIRATSGRNLVTDRRHDRYLLDGADIVRAETQARDEGLDVVGFWHSHPDHSAAASRFDTDHAHLDYVYVICSTTAQGAGDMGAYTLAAEGGPFRTLSIAVGPAAV